MGVLKSYFAPCAGVITLDSSAGSLPVENAVVDWELVAEDGTVVNKGTNSTDLAGRFVLSFNEDHSSLTNDGEVEV